MLKNFKTRLRFEFLLYFNFKLPIQRDKYAKVATAWIRPILGFLIGKYMNIKSCNYQPLIRFF